MCPGDPQTLSDELTKSITCRTDLGANTASEEEEMDYAFLHNTGDIDAKVTFLTMVDNSSRSMVATAVQKQGHDKFAERSRVIRSDWRVGASDRQGNGTDRCGKTRGN